MDYQKIADSLSKLDGTIVMYADGFIDEQWTLVGNRATLTDYTPISKMTGLADKINEVGSGGMGIELIKKRNVFGGFTANIGFAAATLGVNTVMAGLFGEGEIDPVFEPLQKIAKMTTLGRPSITHALEFDDGKILMTNMEEVLAINWDRMVEVLGIDQIRKMLVDSDIIGVGYWSLMPAFDDILAKICENLPNDGKKRSFFFDFADIRKRDEKSLRIVLDLLKSLNDKAPMALSVNEHEGAIIYGLYGETFDDVGRPVAEKAETVRSQVGIEALVIHTPHFAAAATKTGGAAHVVQAYVEKPVRTAGAGDTFNGGYIAGTLAGLNPTERLYVANAAVTYFLNNGFPPTRDKLVELLKNMK